MTLTSQQRLALHGMVNVVIGLAVLGLLLLVLASAGCAKKAIPQATAIVLSISEIRTELPSAYFGDTSYAEVNSAWLPTYYEQFRQTLFDQGVTKWDSRFDCNHFATYYAALAQTKFYAANFQSWTKAQSLAVGTFWYISRRGVHAIAFAVTERGLIFVEPQTGREVNLTQSERQSAFLVTI
jgi:hypothetical protein